MRERRTEGIAIVTRSVNRVIPPPRGPRRKYFRWGKAMRPRKPDETLSRHGLGARRVALLAPLGVLGKYCSPLDYAHARLKLFQEEESISRILGGLHFFGHGGGKPEWGSPQNACILWGPRVGGVNQDNPRDEKAVRSVLGYDEQLDRACLNTTKPLHPQEGVCHFNVRGRQLVFIYEHAEIFGRASPSTMNSLTERP